MSANIFTVKRSEIEGRLDPIYYIRKNELVGYKHLKLEKIGKHFFVKDGDHDKLPDDAVSDENNGFRYLRAQDLKENKIISEKPIYVTKKYFESVRRCHIYPNDLLFSIMASVGATAVVPKNFSICTANRAVGILRAKDEAVFLPEYVQVVLNTELGIKLLELQKRGGIQQRLNLDDISNLELPVFDFEKQRKIIDFYNSALSQKEQKQEQAKELLASIDSYLLSELGITLPQKDNSLSKRIFTTKFSEVTGGRLDPLYQFNSSFLISTKYEQVKLAEICNSFISGFGAGKENQTSEINGIIQIRPTNIDSECELKFDKNIYIDKNFEGKKIKKTDVLFNNTNSQDLVGKTAVGESAENMFFSNHITVISINERIIDSYFLKESLNMLQRHKIFYSICTNWNNQSGIGIDLLKTVKIPLPPLPKQKEIAEHIRSIRAQAKQLQAEAEQILQAAKHQVEKMILGE